MDSIRRKVNDIITAQNKLLEKRSHEAENSAKTALAFISGGSFAAFVLLLLAGFLISRSITRPVGRFMDFVEQVGKGDLTRKAEASSSDEIGRLGGSLNQMVTGLREVAVQTRTATENLNSATAEILASTKQQVASTEEQAAAVQQTTTTLEEISQTGSQISDRAKKVSLAAENTSQNSSAGLQAVQSTSRTMELIQEQAESVAENIIALSQKTQAVGEIISTVNDIAEQSNLLALNAAIEAAAAGDQGRRFSVVANEMKNLADQAKQATVQVRSILGEIQKGINTSVMLTEEAVKRVDSGKQQSQIMEKTIRQMTDGIQESVQAFQQIVAATGQQQIGFEQVTQAMKSIRLATEQTASGINQQEKAAAGINAMAQQLRQNVERYKL
jgi:methyl-accepting chemotaxis protein